MISKELKTVAEATAELNAELQKLDNMSIEGIGVGNKVKEILSIFDESNDIYKENFSKMFGILVKLEVNSANIIRLGKETAALNDDSNMDYAKRLIKDSLIECKNSQSIIREISKLYDELVGDTTSTMVC